MSAANNPPTMTKPKLMPMPLAIPNATPKRALCEIESEK